MYLWVCWLVCANEGLNAQGNTVEAAARFTVETVSAGRGDLEIIVVNPDGQQEKVRNQHLIPVASTSKKLSNN